ncbi:pantoate--beta-alanine ligase [Cellulomonas fimi]|uniref:Pantothenate synthetase n=1 Tax=Cellulomonas fimi (strain ATCC 484 / DSM 20113 / JCM 1341 / CCUG 24087 / LMG 16345 / NBRC 15513 / NCIMB 8980 / NCTC 7547 / NRS-133) TaxID=590998 RepID=F4GY43_CELFA|nr:pantoate--beta-alanine ligase [Cellulomonas fimi]AEE44711.1 pantoate/beta-alanine ligase [Cellulomonas fimi ATCC 484]NNH06146.1 pantoate--beta-alanine ligase [Cellulomonas fimi]VEH27078.1 Pantothenate synthetase [Cellulomonas fimi]
MTAGTTPVLARTRAELAAALAEQDARPGGPGERRPYRRAVVMTMGALHAGHLSLVAHARDLADVVVVTVFVNPLQFGPAEDLSRYPRDLDGDLALLSGPGLLDAADVVFAPGVEEMYPQGDPAVRVGAGPIGDVLEGAARPGHLDGVLTVVLKLLHLTRPDVALFGEKDAQQLAAVRAMVRDLDVPVEVVGAPLVRDVDGLALSSRNAYLSPAERQRARGLSRALRAGAEWARAGAGAQQVRDAARSALTAAGVADDDVDYVALVDPDDFTEVADTTAGVALLLLAVRVGTTRLIDNTAVTLGASRLPDGAVAPGATTQGGARA